MIRISCIHCKGFCIVPTTHHQSKRIHIRRLSDTLPTLSFWAAPHSISYSMWCAKRLFIDELQRKIEVAQSHLVNFMVALLVVCPVNQYVIGFDI